MTNRPEYRPDPNRAMQYAPAVDNPEDLHRCYVGFMASDGVVRLGIVGPGGNDVWVSPFDYVHRVVPPSTSPDEPPREETAAELARGRYLEISGIPEGVRKKPLRFPGALDRVSLPAILESVAQQTGLSIVADDFLHSRETMYYWLLTDRDTYPLRAALDQIARAFGHRMFYRHHVLCVQTMTPGTDLRAEPPPEIMARLRARAGAGQNLEFPDYMALGRLSLLQMEMLVTRRHPARNALATPLMNAYRKHHILRLCASLTRSQWERAESEEGLRPRALNRKQQEAFLAMVGVGLPVRMARAAQPDRSGVYIRRDVVRGRTRALTLTIVPESGPSYLVSHRVSF
ncbi:MAG: hypothetical protein RMJ43_14210 [Chloroherpetonaceae bacterium]|nr:hypothetical protein [Chthonomonadaceae bacterium]MDW8208984.1 hypothetical protein [Chloroherpetonaceae bacterium]